MRRTASGREALDDDHAATATRTWSRQHARLVGRCGLGRLGLFRAGRSGEQLAGAGDVLGALAAGEQAIVRMRWKPAGSTWIRKRRMNSWVGSVISL